MKRGRWAEDGLLETHSRLGVVRAARLVSLGMDSRTVYRRCLPGGPWRRPLPGVILLQHTPPSSDQRVAAALRYAGDDAVVTGLEACRRHGLRPTELPDETGVHLLVPHPRKVRSAEFVTIERTHRLPPARVRDGVPLAPLVRATVDAARRMRAAEPVAKLLIEAIQRGGCSPDAIERELDVGSTRGTAIPRRLLGDVQRLKSIAELHALRLSRRLRRPPTHWNVKLYGPEGDYIGYPDAWWDDVGLAWEIDSQEWHSAGQRYAGTISRNTRYTVSGILVVQTLPNRLLTDPNGVLADLTRAYRTASVRPRPDVVVAES